MTDTSASRPTTAKLPDSQEITKDDDFLLSVFKDTSSGGIFVRMGDVQTGKSIVFSGEAVMHAAAIVEKTFEARKNAPTPRSLN